MGGRCGGLKKGDRVDLWTVDARYRDMVATETLILASLGVLNLLAIVYLSLWFRIHLDQSLMDIDEKLALAIKSLVDKLMEGGLGEFEPPNPVQGAIAQMIQAIAAQKMNTIDATITQRAPDGQFTTMKDFE